eukprot:GHVP01050155.1.p2 GENE.GHVP01050155.1~~GHVP01050155.1.p2  ORF type:complete len:332 (-),score=61.74 GHVP01050155.1:3338-4333(-)
MPIKTTILGAGSFGTSLAILVEEATRGNREFEEKIILWAKDEIHDNRNIADMINEDKENKAYLPNASISKRIHCTSSLAEALIDADSIIIAIPSQFLISVCKDIKGKTKKDAFCLSAVKGIIFEDGEVRLPSEVISKATGLSVSVLSGPTIAKDLANRKKTEASLYSDDIKQNNIIKASLHTSFFRTVDYQNREEIEVCGALKNLVAIGCGIASSIEESSNTTAYILRVGIIEMQKFLKIFYNIDSLNVFLQPCGIGDIYVTIIGGRSFKLGYSKTLLKTKDIESLQGYSTSYNIHQYLFEQNKTEEFPLFSNLFKVLKDELSPKEFIEYL